MTMHHRTHDTCLCLRRRTLQSLTARSADPPCAGSPAAARRASLPHSRPRALRRRRSGLVLGIVLVCVVVALTLATVVTKAVVLNRRQSELADWQLQASWLAESGLQRAVHRLRTTPDYAGETWEVPAASLALDHTGSVVIHLLPDAEDASGRQIRVEAEYPSERPHGVRSVREVPVTPPAAVPPASPS